MSAGTTSFFVVAVAATALALRKRKTTPALYTCGDDCEHCFRKEGRRAPVTPVRSGPKKVEIKAGESVWLCTCGESKNYPYCDGSHRGYNAANGTKFVPEQMKNESAETQTKFLCTWLVYLGEAARSKRYKSVRRERSH